MDYDEQTDTPAGIQLPTIKKVLVSVYEVLVDKVVLVTVEVTVSYWVE